MSLCDTPSSLISLSPCSSSPTLFDPDFTDPERQNYPNRNVLAARSRFSAESMNTSGSVSSRENTLLHEGGMAANPAPDSWTNRPVAAVLRLQVRGITVTLLLYTFATHVDDPNLCINHLKLLPILSNAAFRNAGDLLLTLPLPAFALNSTNFHHQMNFGVWPCVPVLLIQRSYMSVQRPDHYADAMLRIIRKRSRRKSSVSSVASSRTSGASVTDVEEPQSVTDVLATEDEAYETFCDRLRRGNCYISGNSVHYQKVAIHLLVTFLEYQVGGCCNEWCLKYYNSYQ
ncbi:hypothetical protein E0198_001142 [Clavispora lusitaniae]|nr:hypothetical protein E0198_001142 [Clavispora lusitaniae]